MNVKIEVGWVGLSKLDDGEAYERTRRRICLSSLWPLLVVFYTIVRLVWQKIYYNFTEKLEDWKTVGNSLGSA